MYQVDLNSDMGEAFGHYSFGNDQRILESITSANVACGFHAGDPATMIQTVILAKENNVSVGAHPGFRDLVGFGRRPFQIAPEDVYADVLYQIAALHGICQSEGVALKHVKPHGALYNMAARDRDLARAIAKAVKALDHKLILVGLSGSELIHAGEELGLTTASEVFADRTYQSDGSLTPRTEPNALIKDPIEAAERVVQMVKYGELTTVTGEQINIQADTICIHGDHPEAPRFLKMLHEVLDREGIRLNALGDD